MDATPGFPISGNPSVGVIGLGLMGSALAARLLKAGFGVTGFDIDVDKRAELERNGGGTTASASDVFARCRTVVLALFDASQIETIFADLAPDVADPGAILTTCVPERMVGLARRAANHRCSLIEAPISGTSEQARDGSAAALIAGDPRAVQTVQAVLDALNKCSSAESATPAGPSLPCRPTVSRSPAALLRATIALLGGEVDSAAIVEAIRPSPGKRGSSR
jgi:6-phosphogluconate dehydrogenase (decarboxylating)